MFTRATVAASLLLVTAALTPAHATTTFNLSYTGVDDGMVGAVTISGDAESAHPDIYDITSGSLIISGNYTGSGINFPVGTFNLVSNPDTLFGQSTSGDGKFYYDDTLSPSAQPMLNNNGLLFVSASGVEVNLYGDQGLYLYVDSTKSYPTTEQITVGSVQSGLPLAVPEPVSLSILASGVLAAGIVRRRRS